MEICQAAYSAIVLLYFKGAISATSSFMFTSGDMIN